MKAKSAALGIMAIVASILVGGYRMRAADVPKAPTKNPMVIEAFELEDQFGNKMRCEFPRTKPCFLTIADRKGSDQIEAWVTNLVSHFGTQAGIEGVADVSAVPAPLRRMVRGRFKEKFTHPIMLDWKGAVVRRFDRRPEVANVYLIASNGVLLASCHGAFTSTNLAAFEGALKRPAGMSAEAGASPAVSR